MPIYEYLCPECQSRFERIVSGNHGQPQCPKCGSRRSTMQFSTFAARTGNGWHATTASSTSPDSSSECRCTPRSCGCH